MSLRNRNKIIYVITAILIIVVGLFIWFSRVSAPANDSLSAQNAEVLGNFKTIQIGGAIIRAELATTEAEQIQGLSGRTSMATSTGMFFVFDQPSKWGIWMKDMNFPIDVLWITDDYKINYIVENMTPASYPTAYSPRTPARYVLEVPVGTVKNYGITVGQSVIVK